MSDAANVPTEGMGSYQSTKRVLAGEITEVVAAGCFVSRMDGTSMLRVYPPNMTARYTPTVGDFWIVYDDGYQSISPRQPFLDGYRLMEKRGDKILPMVISARDAEINHLACGMQTGLRQALSLGLCRETDTEAIQNGINEAAVTAGALLGVLVAKGICTMDEVKDEKIVLLRRGVAAMEAQIGAVIGTEVKLT